VKQSLSKNSKTISWTYSFCWRNSRETNKHTKNKYVKYRMQAPAVAVLCDQLKQCLTQAIKSCFSANEVILRDLRQNCRQKFSQPLVDRLVKRKKTALVLSCVHEERVYRQLKCDLLSSSCRVFWSEASFQSVTGGLARRLCETRPEKLKSEARTAESGDGVGFWGSAVSSPNGV